MLSRLTQRRSQKSLTMVAVEVAAKLNRCVFSLFNMLLCTQNKGIYMKIYSMISMLILFSLLSCSKTKDVSGQLGGEIAVVAKNRNLTKDSLLAAVKTYMPSGGRDEFLAFIGTGVSGRLVVMGIPSMKILKYVAVFSAEAWQGFSFDDESKSVLRKSHRSEIGYTFGDMGTPVLSLTKGEHNGEALFVADASNARLGFVDLKEYETKQVVSNPLFLNSNPDISLDSNTTFIAQTTERPEFIESLNKSTSGVTFWRVNKLKSQDHGGYHIDQRMSFSVVLPSLPLSAPVMGRGKNDNLTLFISESEIPYLDVIKFKQAAKVVGLKGVSIKGHLILTREVAEAEGVLSRFQMPKGSYRISISGDGQHIAILNKMNSTISMGKIDELLSGKALQTVDVGGASLDAIFTDSSLYVTVNNPSKVVKISLSTKKVLLSHSLDFPVGKILIPESETQNTKDNYAIVTNHLPYGRFTRTGPQSALSAHLLDLRNGMIKGLYDASIPQTTRLSGVAMSTKVNKPVFRYKIGTNPRTGLISDYKTNAGKERVVRDGKRVHVYATVIRSHITPDTIEVEQGDVVTIHVTSSEQSKDNTHGFTIDSYNVHGSFEPGKTASVTFLADRPGVFPFYCTEFCSALHLEMQGYLLVKPVELKKINSAKLTRMRTNPEMTNFFNYLKGERL